MSLNKKPQTNVSLEERKIDLQEGESPVKVSKSCQIRENTQVKVDLFLDEILQKRIDEFNRIYKLCSLSEEISIDDMRFVLKCDPESFEGRIDNMNMDFHKFVKNKVKNIKTDGEYSGRNMHNIMRFDSKIDEDGSVGWVVTLQEYIRKHLLQDKEFQGCDFSGIDFGCADFFKSNLTGANFRASNLERVSLDRTNLSGADFFGAKLPDGCVISENGKFYGPGMCLMANVKNR